MTSNAYQYVTDLIIQKLEEGTVPWHMPWKCEPPANYISGNRYRGINKLVLGMAGHESPYWASFKQVNSAGGSVLKGQRGTRIVFVNLKEYEDDESGEVRKVPFLRQYTVFHVATQTDIDVPEVHGPPVNAITRCEQVIDNMPMRPSLTYDGGSRAYYDWKLDSVHLPRTFDSSEEKYCTSFHELVHSTGHKIRLNRPTITQYSPFGSDSYCQEELIAELGASFLCSETGISNVTLDNSAAYINGWLKKLRSADKRFLIQCASAAEKACDFILDRNQKDD